MFSTAARTVPALTWSPSFTLRWVMRPKAVAPTFTYVLGLIWPVPLTMETMSWRDTLAVATLVTADRPWRMVPTMMPARIRTTTAIRTIFFMLIAAFFMRPRRTGSADGSFYLSDAFTDIKRLTFRRSAH